MQTRSFTGCDILFRRYFARWYRPEDLAQRGYQASRPDVEVFSVAIGQDAVFGVFGTMERKVCSSRRWSAWSERFGAFWWPVF